MSTDWAWRTKGTDHRRYPNKPGRTLARRLGQRERDRNQRERLLTARAQMAVRVARAAEARARKMAAAS